MKIKIRPDDVGTPSGNEWAEMNGWLAELREDSPEGPVDDRQRGPVDDRQRGPVDDRQRGPVDDRPGGPVDDRQRDSAGGSQRGPVDGRRGDRAGNSPVRPASDNHARPARHGYAAPPAAAQVRAVIGDELRIPIIWCEMGSCISWHTDRAALGQADVRARAIRAGWRIDALGRLACPQCQQTDVAFRATRPVVLWDRSTAIAMAARATAPDSRSARATAPGGWSARATVPPSRRPAVPAVPPSRRPAVPAAGPYGRNPRQSAAGPR